MVKVGILGVGFMGKMHFTAYNAIRGAKVVALGDIDERKLSGDWSSIGGNIDGAEEKVDLSGIHTHAKAAPDLMKDPDVDVVDITLPTFLHAKFATAALKAGKINAVISGYQGFRGMGGGDAIRGYGVKPEPRPTSTVSARRTWG